MSNQRVSPAGRVAIREREGCKTVAYRDSVGVWTIGVGHTGRMAPPRVLRGMTITLAQADEYLAADLAPIEAEIDKRVKVPLTQNERDAIASWLFNVGEGDLRSSTILARLNLGDLAGAAAGFDRYHRPPEIIGRRNGEKAQFLRLDADTTRVTATRSKQLTSRAAGHAARVKPSVGVAMGSATAGAAVVAASPHPVAHGLAAMLAAIGASGFALWSHRRAGTLANFAGTQAHAAAA